MINYTERIALLMHDIVVRTPRLSFIDLREVIVFGRFGRSDAEGAFATCHCMTLPESEPGYFTPDEDGSPFPLAIQLEVPEPGHLIYSWFYGWEKEPLKLRDVGDVRLVT